MTSDPLETAGDSESESTGPADEGGNGFIADTTGGGGVNYECDPFLQDCESGFKCAHFANDGGNSVNATQCVPVVEDPAKPGEGCTSEGWVTGIDTCSVGAWCWDVDPETGEGMCVSLCTGSLSSPTCDAPEEQCITTKEFGVCLPICNPVEQPCPVGCGCYPGGDDEFFCTPDASGPDEGAYGSPCEFINSCDPGFFCANAELVPDCNGSQGCCAPFCDFTVAGSCPGLFEGEECVPWFEEGMPVAPELTNVGACVVEPG